MKKKINNIRSIMIDLFFSIREVFKSNPIFFIVSLLIQLLNTLSYFIILYLSKKIIDIMSSSLNDNVPITESLSNISLWLITSAAFTLGLVLINYIKSVYMRKQQLAFNEYVNIKMAQKCMNLDISYFDNPQYYDKIANAQEGKIRFGFIVYRVIFFIANIISFGIALIFSLVLSNIFFTFLILLLTFPVLFTRGHYYKEQFEYESSSQKIKRKIGYLAGLILGKEAAKEIRFFKMEKYLSDKYQDNWVEYATGKRRIIMRRGLIDSVLSALPIVGIMFSLYFVIIKIVNGENQIGDFTYFLGIYTSLSSNFLSLIDDLGKLNESKIAIQKYNDFMLSKSNLLYEGDLAIDYVEQIQFKNVSFVYPKTENIVLKNVNFTLYPSKRNAIIGINGSGKTTIVKLLLRFYDVTEGEILINDINIKKYNIDSLRSKFSAVFQDFVIYSLSIRDNISFSNHTQKYDDNLIFEALEFAELKKDILQKTITLDTFLSRDFTDDGIELSGGQKQKIAIARCGFSKSQILVLDEPTSSLDPEAEFAIISKLDLLYKNKGLILVSHRLSNMKTMDNIIVIKNGVIIEEGTHDELFRQRKEYFTLFSLQANKYKTEDEI